MDDERTAAADEDAPGLVVDDEAGTARLVTDALDDDRPRSAGVDEGAAAVPALAWDDDLPSALGEETDVVGPRPHDGKPSADAAMGEAAAGDVDGDGLAGGRGSAVHDDGVGSEIGDEDGADLGELSDDQVGGRRNALPRRVESWRTRSATGAIATALAMGLQQVFEPEKRRPAAVAEAPSDPYSEDDPITVDYIPDDAGGTTVHVKPWLLQKEDPA